MEEILKRLDKIELELHNLSKLITEKEDSNIRLINAVHNKIQTSISETQGNIITHLLKELKNPDAE